LWVVMGLMWLMPDGSVVIAFCRPDQFHGPGLWYLSIILEAGARLLMCVRHHAHSSWSLFKKKKKSWSLRFSASSGHYCLLSIRSDIVRVILGFPCSCWSPIVFYPGEWHDSLKLNFSRWLLEKGFITLFADKKKKCIFSWTVPLLEWCG